MDNQTKDLIQSFNKIVPNGWDNRVIFEFVTGANQSLKLLNY